MRHGLLRTIALGAAGTIGCASVENPASDAGSSAGSGAALVGGAGGTSAGASSGAGASGKPGGATGGVSAGGSGPGGGGNAGSGASVSGTGGGNAGLSNGGTSARAGSGPGGGGNGGASSGGVAGGGGIGAGGAGKSGAASGGVGAMGGAGSGAGGSTSMGGAAGAMAGAAGSVDPPCPPQTPPSGGKQYCGTSGDGTADGSYTYNLWSDGQGMGCITVYGVDAAFKATWMNVGDWIGRVGLSFDKTKTYDKIGTFSSDFSYTMSGITTGGFGNVGIYGWSVNPLHEFYIEENWLGKPPNFTKVTSFTIEGEGTYEVMTNQQKNQPNITGTNQDFVQYWSVRSTPRQCGHISISKHFDEWASLGLSLGNMEEVRMSVEGQNNSGTIDFTQATVVVK